MQENEENNDDKKEKILEDAQEVKELEHHAHHHPESTQKKSFKFKLVYLVVIIIAVSLSLGVVYFFTTGTAGVTGEGQIAAAGDNVSVYYTGSFTNGTIFNSNVGSTPFSFILNSGDTIPGFNDAVLGMKVGETKNVTLPPSEAYGEVNQSLVITIPVSEFGNQSISIGEEVSNGYEDGFIQSFNSTNATINFNPPLAGDTLVFQITLVKINN